MFTLGNIITIVIMLIILFVYRFLDKDNRTIEKVKKYADKLRDDLASYADQRAEDIKAYAIDLEVQQQAAKEVLRRVQASEQSLSANADKISGIAERIGQYDKALAELKEMSGRVDKNLAIIHDESAFVDNVAKTLKITKDEVKQLQDSIPSIRETLAVDAKVMLDDMKLFFSNELQSNIDESAKQFDAFKDDAKAVGLAISEMRAKSIQDTENRHALIKQELDSAFKNAHTVAEKLEDISLQKLNEQINQRSIKLSEAIDIRFNELRDQAKLKIAETQEMIKTIKADWKKDAESIEADLAKSEALYLSRYDKIEAKSIEIANNMQDKIKEQLKAYQDETVAKQSALKTSIKTDLAETKLSAELASKTLKEILNSFTADINKTVSDQKEQLFQVTSDLELAKKKSSEMTIAIDKSIVKVNADLESKIAIMSENTSKALNDSTQKTNEIITSLNTKFMADSANLENKVLTDFDKRSSELRELVENGLNRLESMRFDADRMEAALRDIITGVERNIENDFVLFTKDIKARHSSFEAEFKTEIVKIREVITDIDTQVNGLKSKTYNDVSEKLKIFEDEFFADLKARTAEADKKFSEWTTDMNERLAAAMRDADAARLETEQKWSSELRARFSETQSKLQEQVDKLVGQIDMHRSAISDRIAEADGALVSLKASSKDDLDDARKAANAYINTEIDKWKHESGERISEAYKQIEQDKKIVNDLIASTQANIKAANEFLANELTKSSQNFNATMKAAEIEQAKSIDGFKQTYQANIAAISASWVSERNNILDDIKQDRNSVVSDIKNLSDNVDTLKNELTQKTNQALDDFSKAYDKFNQDAIAKSNAAVVAMNASVDDYKKEAMNLQNKFNTIFAQVTSSLDDEKKNREKIFADMDKKIKEFQVQTKLFERSDALQAKLSEAIDGIKSDLGHIESRRAELAELETQYSRIKRLEDELGQKIARFMAEKRRLDTMEDDFKRLITLSQAVDQKLATITESNDQLTQMQADFRRLSDIAAEANEKYERVEKKANILVTSADAIDKNFAAAHELEQNLKKLDSDIKAIPNQIMDLKKSMSEIMEFKPTLDNTIEKLDDVNDVLSDAEKRISDLQVAREWLARTETRFEELNTKTEGHLKLLNAILKDEPSKDKKDKGAPSIEIQEAVRKLAHRGWKVVEIANSLKLSRGEVELILEMSDRKD